jgi:hypothetical protein
MPQAPVSSRALKLSNRAIARDAIRWIGQPYHYGAPDPQFPAAPGNWDCSSFVSWVLGHDLRLSTPGGKWGSWPATEHGPVVVDYANWDGAITVGTPIPGDLCCFVGVGASGHIGIAVSATEMVSALNPSRGTLRTPIAGYGPAGAPLIYRRVNGITVLGGLAPPPASGKPGRSPLQVIVLTGLLFAGAFAALGLAAAAVIAGGGWVIRKAAQ